MNATVHFSIKYDGPVLATHQMDVRDLVPALIALSSLLEEANRALYPDSAEVRVNVNGSFKGGSFGVDFVALQSIKDQIVSIFAGPGATAAANLFAILSGIGILGAGGLIGLIKWLRGRKPSSIRIEGDKTIFELKLEQTVETFEVDLAAGKLYQSRIVRQSLARVVKPLETEGIDVFACGQDGETETVVSKEEAEFFAIAASGADVVSDAFCFKSSRLFSRMATIGDSATDRIRFLLRLVTTRFAPVSIQVMKDSVKEMCLSSIYGEFKA